MGVLDFRLHILGGTVSLEDWRQAMAAPESDLPKLNDAQKEAARFVRMGEPEYARGVLADQLGNKRQQEKGRRLGGLIGNILERRGDQWRLDSLVRKGARGAWVARFAGVEHVGIEVEIPHDLVDDVDSGDQFPVSRLEELLNNKLGAVARRVAS